VLLIRRAERLVRHRSHPWRRLTTVRRVCRCCPMALERARHCHQSPLPAVRALTLARPHLAPPPARVRTFRSDPAPNAGRVGCDARREACLHVPRCSPFDPVGSSFSICGYAGRGQRRVSTILLRELQEEPRFSEFWDRQDTRPFPESLRAVARRRRDNRQTDVDAFLPWTEHVAAQRNPKNVRTAPTTTTSPTM
jgi:hypothetical protein